MHSRTISIQWYQYDAEHAPMNALPHLEETPGESVGFSVDVLVFGLLDIDAGPEHIKPRYGIGYVDGRQAWHVYTSDGNYPNSDEIGTFTVLAWAYLPDAPDNLLHTAEKAQI